MAKRVVVVTRVVGKGYLTHLESTLIYSELNRVGLENLNKIRALKITRARSILVVGIQFSP